MKKNNNDYLFTYITHLTSISIGHSSFDSSACKHLISFHGLTKLITCKKLKTPKHIRSHHVECSTRLPTDEQFVLSRELTLLTWPWQKLCCTDTCSSSCQECLWLEKKNKNESRLQPDTSEHVSLSTHHMCKAVQYHKYFACV